MWRVVEDQVRVVFATEGKDADTIAAFADDLIAHGGNPAIRDNKRSADGSATPRTAIMATVSLGAYDVAVACRTESQ